MAEAAKDIGTEPIEEHPFFNCYKLRQMATLSLIPSFSIFLDLIL